MTEKIQKYINRTQRLINKYPLLHDKFPESEEKEYTVLFLMRWLDWNAIPVCSMSKQDVLELQSELKILLSKNKHQQLNLF